MTATTANVTPNTPATVASVTVTRLSTWLIPTLPQVKPPSGQRPRSQSKSVHRAAAPNAETTGRPGRRMAGYSAPNSASESAITTVRETQASSPKRQIQ